MLMPVYDFNEKPSCVLLYEGHAAIKIDNHTYDGLARVYFELVPRPRINIYVDLESCHFPDKRILFSGIDEVSSCSINGVAIDGFCTKIDAGRDSGAYTVKWSPSKEPVRLVRNKKNDIKKIIFHLFNFVDFIGTKNLIHTADGKQHRLPTIDLVYEDWNIEINSTVDTTKNFEQLKIEGGYRLTHVGCITKKDGKLFSHEEARSCLTALKFVISFAVGYWCEPICPVGFDAGENRVFEYWSSPRGAWHSGLSWFDHHRCEQLVEFFKKFMDKWTVNNWRETFEEVIYWYLSANLSSRGIDVGIILTQAAIERLSYEYSVVEKKLLLAKGFKDLWASDKFRLLFSSLKIPIKIPSSTKDLSKLAASPQMKWVDGPHALTEIRNSLIHPDHKMKRRVDLALFDAWNLGLWYLEMGILAICGYSGAYGNRLQSGRWQGQVETVPWG